MSFIFYNQGSILISRLSFSTTNRNTPILYLHNITGFMVGKKYEEEGIIKAGSRFINAVSNSEVPCITIVMWRRLTTAPSPVRLRRGWPRPASRMPSL